jgi:hypothetical protein
VTIGTEKLLQLLQLFSNSSSLTDNDKALHKLTMMKP